MSRKKKNRNQYYQDNQPESNDVPVEETLDAAQADGDKAVPQFVLGIDDAEQDAASAAEDTASAIVDEEETAVPEEPATETEDEADLDETSAETEEAPLDESAADSAATRPWWQTDEEAAEEAAYAAEASAEAQEEEPLPAEEDDPIDSSAEEDDGLSAEVEEAPAEAADAEEDTADSEDETEQGASESEDADEETETEDSPAPAEGASSDEPKEEALSEEELRRAEEERLRAEEKAKRKAERKEKTKEWFRKHKILVIVLCVVFVVGVGMTVGHFVTTMHVAFIHKAEDLDKAIANNKKTEYIVKSDVVYNGDLAIGDVDIDMNKHTLQVNGNLMMEGEGFVGYKAFYWGKPKAGGVVNVQGTYVQTGNRAWYSTLMAATVGINGDLAVGGDIQTTNLDVNGNLTVSGTVEAESVHVGGDLSVAGKMQAPVTLGDTSKAVVEGEALSLDGGATVTVKGSVGTVTGADALYVYPESQLKEFNVHTYYFVEYLEAPTVLVKEENGSQTLLISHVHHADGYEIGIDGKEEVYNAKKNAAGDNTAYSLPNLEPGDYTIRVKPYANESDVYVAGAETKIKVSYYVQLTEPHLDITKEVREDGTHVTLTIGAVSHAGDYVICVGGKKVKVNAGEDDVQYDLTAYVSEVGSYDVYVYAEPPKKTNYKQSESAMITYVSDSTVSVEIAGVLAPDSGPIVATITGGANVYYYRVEWTKAGAVVQTTYVLAQADSVTVTTALTIAEVDGITVTPLAKGYYKSGEAKSASVPMAPVMTAE